MTRRDDSLVGRALRACVRQEGGTVVHEAVARGLLRRLIESGRYHRVLNLVYLGVAGLPDADTELADGLKRYHLHQVGHHLRALEDVASLRSVLDAEGVQWMLVKGPVLSEVVYERPDLRVYHDLDVVIPRDAFPIAIHALEGAGYEVLDRNWDLIRREGRSQLHVSLRLGTVADVHHHLLNRATVRRSFDVPMSDLFARARTVSLGGVAVRTLDPVDTLLHLCVHAALGGGHRLLWLKDVQQSVANEAPPWEQVEDRARAWRVAALVGIVLQRAMRELDVSVPHHVIHRLQRGRSGRAVSALCDRAWPPNRASDRMTPALLWAQVARDTWPGTVAAFGARTMRPLMKATGRRAADEDWAHAPVGSSPDGMPLMPASERAEYLHDLEEPDARSGTG